MSAKFMGGQPLGPRSMTGDHMSNAGVQRTDIVDVN